MNFSMKNYSVLLTAAVNIKLVLQLVEQATFKELNTSPYLQDDRKPNVNETR